MPIAGSFSGAHNFVINDSVFNEAHRDVHNHNITNNIGNLHSNTSWDPLKLLFDTAASGALHNSEESFPRKGCHPDTRATALREIKHWREGNHRVLWLHGAAGIGKSAIAQTVAEQCTAEGRRVAAFFFLRGDPKRSHGKHFCATLAAQIYRIPEARQSLRQAIIDDPLIFGQSLDDQFKKLFVEPLQTLAPGAANVVVIIDGLDECQAPRTQNEILLAIENSLRSSPSLPVSFLIASRPEPNIKRAFEHDILQQFASRIALYHSYDSDQDIHAYLWTGFADIRKNHGTSIAESWPSDETLDLLVNRSSGQFIYAATVLKFVGDENFLPTGRLKTVIDASDSRALSTLDDLYLQILSTCHPNNTDCLHAVLAMILVLWNPTCGQIDRLLGIEAGQSRVVLRHSHSLLSIPADDDVNSIAISHKSFSDFLQDRSRSGRFFVDVAVHHVCLAKRCMRWIVERQQAILLCRLEGIERFQCNYAMGNWSYHALRPPQGDADPMDTLQQFEHDAFLFDIFPREHSGKLLMKVLAWLEKQPGYHNWPSSSLSRCPSNEHGLQRHIEPVQRPPRPSAVNKLTQPGCTCTDRLVESFKSRRSNISLNFALQWGTAPPYLEPDRPSDRYVLGDLNTVAERDNWRRAAVLWVLDDPKGFDVVAPPWAKRNSGSYDAAKITQALDNDLGNVVRRFSDSILDCDPARDHIEYSRAILSILRKLNLVERLLFSSRSVHPVLVEEFTQALRQMRELHTVNLWLRGGSLNFLDICLCVGSWPHLQSLEVHDFEWGQWLDHEVSRPECLLVGLYLFHGRILAPQLRFLTVSSHSSLSYVRLNGITGLSNADLREWLSEVAPSLQSLELRNSLFPRERHDEEHAIDATIHMMCGLTSAWFDGDVISALAIERKTSEGFCIFTNHALSVDDPGLIRALACTGFARVVVDGVAVLWKVTP